MEQSQSESSSHRTGGNDAVAFTSGPQGAPFSAGVVHAWLAADRRPPLVATGISTGAISAAAMRRVYQELEHEDDRDLEAKRWSWYQRYYQAIIADPLAPIWRSVPDPIDFSAETPPAKDPSVPESLKSDSEEARRHYYLLIKLAVWLANLPIRVSTLATLLVMYVRLTEGYGVSQWRWLSAFINTISLLWNAGITAIGLLFHVIRRPQWIVESAFATQAKRIVRPLFGWTIYLMAVAAPILVLAILYAEYSGLHRLTGWSKTICALTALILPIALAGSAIGFWIRRRSAFQITKPAASKKKRTRPSLLDGNLDITRSLLHPYEIKRAIYDLFVKDAPDFTQQLSNAQVKAVFVCAALEEVNQVSLKETLDIGTALIAALAIPALLPPQKVDGAFLLTNPTTANTGKTFHIVDGAAVRFNPLPAFFHWCKHAGKSLTDKLERSDKTPTLHVVYNVPTQYDGLALEAPGIPCPDIVESALNALKLERRRDTRQEVRQTNELSHLEWLRRQLQPNKDGSAMAIFADEIAPRQQIELGNVLSPDPDKLRRTIADGCRATLETLYTIQLAQQSHEGRDRVLCSDLLKTIAPRRKALLEKCGGLGAVCDSCTGQLEYRKAVDPSAPQPGLLQTYGFDHRPTPAEIAHRFPQLAEERPKVVFLGSGGVFRGAFHIGVLAAMYQAKLFPDLVVGASVGTLMGGALCRLTTDQQNAPQVLTDLAALFAEVDKKVSLTLTLKNASKQLGIRLRRIRLSPSELARKVRQGSKADPGFAATGAPPVLTDALAEVFAIPHQNTAAIASEFVAGHISAAVASFLGQVRRETLPSFDITNCIMGASLLEDQAKLLMGFDANRDSSKVQPYQQDGANPKVAFFATTSFLNASCSLLLGRDFLSPCKSWNAVQEGLCSSAFPAVFAARAEADLLPGIGRTGRFFADGGMFDNLPFFPAFEVLLEIQKAAPFADSTALQKLVLNRGKNPNLIVSAGLNQRPLRDPNQPSDTITDIKKRARTLSYESKTSTFVTSLRKRNQILIDLGEKPLEQLSAEQQNLLNTYVSGTVVSITPSDEQHINPTFAFCKSLGLKKARVQASIGDGCFQSLAQFSTNTLVARQLPQEVTLPPQQPKLQFWKRLEFWKPPKPAQPTGSLCPYFQIGGKPFQCPFSLGDSADVQGVYNVCKTDPVHRAAVFQIDRKLATGKPPAQAKGAAAG